MPFCQPTRVLPRVLPKTILNCLLPILGLLLACERPKDAPAPTGPLLKATIDGVPWQTTEAVFILHPLYKRPTLYGSLVKGSTVHSAFEIILLDSIRVGYYPNLVLPTYYEDDYRQSWSPSTEYAFRITRYEKQRVWGFFSFTAVGNQPNTDEQLPVRQIVQGAFVNLPVVGIAGVR